MKNTTNILLIVVIILMVALMMDKRLEKNTLQADSGGAIDHIIFTPCPLKQGAFYILCADKKIVMYYEFDSSTKSILLRTARQFNFDELLLESYTAKGSNGDSHKVVKSFVENKK